MAVNILQCVVLGDAQSCLANAGGRPLVFWFMREWVRFRYRDVRVRDGRRGQRNEGEGGSLGAAPARAGRVRRATERVRCSPGPAVPGEPGDGWKSGRAFCWRGSWPGAGACFDQRRKPGSAVVSREVLQSADRATLGQLMEPGMLEPVPSAGSLLGPSPERPRACAVRLRSWTGMGVLNGDHGHVGTRERFEWIPGALDAIRLLTESGRHVFVVTNQSGVARRSGGTIDDACYCPHHPDAGTAPYRQVCADSRSAGLSVHRWKPRGVRSRNPCEGNEPDRVKLLAVGAADSERLGDLAIILEADGHGHRRADAHVGWLGTCTSDDIRQAETSRCHGPAP